MNRENPRNELLNHVLAEEGAGGGAPLETVLKLVRREKEKRRQRRLLMCTGSVLLLLLAIFTMRKPISVAPSEPPVVASGGLQPAPAAQTEEPMIRIERVSDQELLDLLEGSPVALVELPDGKRQLLMIREEPAPEF